MTFVVPCPNCGPREVDEFSFGGESTKRPEPGSPEAELTRYLYFRRNVQGWETEWWYHRDGCRRWFLAERHTVTNRFRNARWPRAGGGEEEGR
jgi:sarcosine oxidase subunit delta